MKTEYCLLPSFRRRPESRTPLKPLDSGLGFGILRHSTSSIHGVVRRNDGKIMHRSFPTSCRCRGFTLLEVIVALAVIAFALAAAASTVTNNTRNASGLQQRTYAHWVAMNKLAELQIDKKWPAIRSTRGSSLLARHEWFWTIKVSKTPDKKDLLRRVDVMVRAAEDDESPLVTLTGYVGRP